MDEAEWDVGHRRPPEGPLLHVAPRRVRTGARRARRPASRHAEIVNTRSESGLYGNAGQVNYAAAKAGIASMTIVMARELERSRRAGQRIAPVARTRLTEALAGEHMKPTRPGSIGSHPRTSLRPRCWLASDLARRPERSGGEGAGRRRAAARGLAPAHGGRRATSRGRSTRVDAASAPRCSAKSDGTIPPFFFPSRAEPPMKLEWSAEDEAFRAELIASSTSSRPPEVKVGRDFSDGGVDEVGGHDIIPQWGRDWQATLFDHGWMIPAYPPELGGRNATPVQTLDLHGGAGASVGSCAACTSPVTRSLRRACSTSATTSSARSSRLDPRRHRLVHRHERAQRGQRPRVAHDASRARRRPLRRQRSEGVDVVLDGRGEVLLLRAHDPDAPKHKGITVLIIDMDTPGIDVRPLQTHHRRGGLRRGVLHRRRGARRPTSSATIDDGWRITRDRSRTSGRVVAAVSGDGAAARRRPLRDGPPSRARRRCGRASAAGRGVRTGGVAAGARLQGFLVVRAGQLGARAQLLEAGDERARQDAVRARHAAAGTVRRRRRSRARRRERPLGAVVLRQLRQHGRGRIERDPAQHHRHSRPRDFRRRWTSRSPTNRVLFATPRTTLFAAALLHVGRPRTHDGSDAADPLWQHLREWVVLGEGPPRTCVCSSRSAVRCSHPVRTSRPRRSRSRSARRLVSTLPMR